MSKDWYEDIVDFQKGTNRYPKPFKPAFLSASAEDLRRELIREEVSELFTAMSDKNLPMIADGITDSIVVLIGAAVEHGIDLRPIWNEVHKTNMAKLGGPTRVDGKQLKPEGWQPPNVQGILQEQGGNE